MRHSNSRRSRGRNNNNRRSNNPKSNTYDSNGPDVRIRGNATQIVEKYTALARDAASGGDNILAESYYQHAEHYQRIMNEFAAANERKSDQSQDDDVKANNGQDQENSKDANSDDADKKPAKKRAPRAKKPQTVDA